MPALALAQTLPAIHLARPRAQTLPLELLGAIFEHALASAASSASALRPLAHVCAQWAAAARAYAALWRSISTRADGPRWAAEALSRAARARDLRLDVSWDPHAGGAPVRAHVARMLCAALRARELALSGPALAGRLRYVPAGTLPRLRRLELVGAGAEAEDVGALFQRAMPALRELSVARCTLPWSASAVGASLGQTLRSLGLRNLPYASRPSPKELHGFLSALSSLEDLSLDHVLPIYPPAGSPSMAALPPVRLPRLHTLSLEHDSAESAAGFLDSVADKAAGCALALAYNARQRSRNALSASITSLAVAAHTFLCAPPPSSTTTLPPAPAEAPEPEKYTMALREGPGRRALLLELSAAGSHVPLCRLSVSAEPEPAPRSPSPAPAALPLSSPPPPAAMPPAPTYAAPVPIPAAILALPDNADAADDCDWAALLPLVLARARPIECFSVDAAPYAAAQPWAWSFAATPGGRGGPARVVARGASAGGLVAALSAGGSAPRAQDVPGVLLPPEFYEPEGAEAEAAAPAPLLRNLAHLRLEDADLGGAFGVELADALVAREKAGGAARVECVEIAGCRGVREAQVDALRSCAAVGRVEWDGAGEVHPA